MFGIWRERGDPHCLTSIINQTTQFLGSICDTITDEDWLTEIRAKAASQEAFSKYAFLGWFECELKSLYEADITTLSGLALGCEVVLTKGLRP